MEDIEYEVLGGETSSEPKGELEATPSEEPTPEPSETVEAPTEPEADDSLFELPDGRKVKGDEVVNEYKNLLADYTRKSQELSQLKNPEKKDIINNEVDYKDPEWTPQSYSEIIELAKQEIYKDFEAKQKAEEDFQKNLESEADAQISAVKQIDPKVDENKLFAHATKYGFTNLTHAYQNMKDMQQTMQKAVELGAKNAKKTVDPVAAIPGQGASVDDTDVYDPSMGHGSLVDYLRTIKN